MKSEHKNLSVTNLALFTCFLEQLYFRFVDLLINFDCTLEQLTKLNYLKLNSEPTNHGWKDAT